MNKRTFTVAAVLASSLFAVGVSRNAGATPNFPPAIESDLSLSYQPDCSICHTDGDTGGVGTVNTPFGKNMRARGLVEYDTSSLEKALTAMQTEMVTSAGGCVDDIAELKEGHDPNTPGDSASCDGGTTSTPSSGDTGDLKTPAYGCGAEVAPRGRTSSPIDAVALGLVAVIALSNVRRRKSR